MSVTKYQREIKTLLFTSHSFPVTRAGHGGRQSDEHREYALAVGWSPCVVDSRVLTIVTTASRSFRSLFLSFLQGPAGGAAPPSRLSVVKAMGGKSETTATSGAAPNAVGGIVSDQNTPLANGDVGTLGSESADQVFQRAAELLRRGDHGEALTSLNTVVDTLKDDTEKGRQRSDPSLSLAAHSGRAMCFTALGQRADAVQAHSLVLAMAAESKLSNWEATAWGDLGDAYAAADMESDGMEARSFAELLVKEGKGVARVDKAGVGQGDVPHLDKILGSVDLSEWKDTDIYKSVTSFEKMAAVAAQMKSEVHP